MPVEVVAIWGWIWMSEIVAVTVAVAVAELISSSISSSLCGTWAWACAAICSELRFARACAFFDDPDVGVVLVDNATFRAVAFCFGLSSTLLRTVRAPTRGLTLGVLGLCLVSGKLGFRVIF